jgi:hypothetical protein
VLGFIFQIGQVLHGIIEVLEFIKLAGMALKFGKLEFFENLFYFFH